MRKFLIPAILAIMTICIPFTEYAQSKTITLEDGNYFNGKRMVPFKEMVLKDGKIALISEKGDKAEGQRIELFGRYVIPGLIDAHVHLAGTPVFEPLTNANSALNCGVTTMVDLFYTEDGFKDIRSTANAEPDLYSTMIMSGPILTAPGGHGTEYSVPTRTITSVAEATSITNKVIDNGVDVIKLVYEADSQKYIPSMNIEMVKAIVAVAHKRGKKVFAHIDLAHQAVECAEVGVDVIAHMPVDELTDAQLRKLKASGIIMIPTITVIQRHLEGFDAQYMSDPLLWKTADPANMKNFEHAALAKPAFNWFARIAPHEGLRKNMANCIKYDIPILAGTDAGNEAVFFGYSLHHEIAQYVKAGMTNADALCSATQNIALVFPDIKTGKIEKGYDADLVVLDADPLKDISNTKTIEAVYHKGQLAKLLPPDTTRKNADVPKFDASTLNVNNLNSKPTNVFSFADKQMGGSSEISMELISDGGVKVLHVTGKVVKKGYMGYAMVGFGFGYAKSAVDVSDYKGVEFDVKGNDETYTLQLLSTSVKDYNYHCATYKAEKEWKTVRIAFSDLKQSPFYGKIIPLDLKTISGVSFAASGRDYNVDYELKNVRLVK